MKKSTRVVIAYASVMLFGWVLYAFNIYFGLGLRKQSSFGNIILLLIMVVTDFSLLIPIYDILKRNVVIK